ncbi:hypothetical protein M758_2G020900 [Ceratodon purpureus]|nr:hypothetical protein M758_2G020900 [Ceratodon purpureus]
MLLDTNGDTTLLVVDKHAIMHRLGIHARDLRILDPLLSYPSTILGRERAIVLNLEHIKAIITAEEVLLRDLKNEFVVPLVEELRRQLPGGGSDSLEHEGSEAEGKHSDGNGNGNGIGNGNGNGNENGHCATWSPHHIDHDDKISDNDASPFEFRALEIALVAIFSFLDSQTTKFEKDACPALDELTVKVSSRNLDRVRKLKSRMTRLNARVQKISMMTWTS